MDHTFSLVPTIDKNESVPMAAKDAPLFFRKRYYVAFFIFTGFILLTLLQINLSICLVDFTSSKTITIGNTTTIQEPEFTLTPPQKGVILSAHYWGYLTSPVGALISNKLGGTNCYGFSIFLTGLCTISTPFIIQWNLTAFIFVQLLEGILHGIAVASCLTAFVKWIPPNERTRFICFTSLGISAGAAISYPVAGIINYYWNWEYVFYITGSVTVVWYIIWYFTIGDEPSKDKFITQVERKYFKETCPEIVQNKVTIPWRFILTSLPVLAYWNDRFVESWSYSFLMTCLPLFIKDVYPSNIKDIGIFSGIPHFFNMVSIIVCSWIMDYLRAKGTRTKTMLHKTFILIGQIPAACLLIILGFGLDFQYTMIGLSLFKICFSSAYACYYTLPLDMSLEHANLIYAAAMTFKSVGGMINPIVMGFMVKNHLPEEWHQYFWFLSIFNLWGAIIFAKYGSGEVQPWAHSYEKSEEPHSPKEID